MSITDSHFEEVPLGLIGEPFTSTYGEVVSLYAREDWVELHVGQPSPTVSAFRKNEVLALGQGSLRDGIVRLGRFGNLDPRVAHLGDRVTVKEIVRVTIN